MTENLLQRAQTLLWAPVGVTQTALEGVLSRMMAHCIDYADLYFELSHSESWFLEEGIVKHADYTIEQGVGVRAIQGETTGFAYADDLLLPSIQKAANAAVGIAKKGKTGAVSCGVTPIDQHPSYYVATDPLTSLDESEKVGLLRSVDEYTRSLDSRVVEVDIGLSASYQVIIVMGSDGTLAADIRPTVRLSIGVMVEEAEQKNKGQSKKGRNKKRKREKGSAGGGARASYAYFFEQDRAKIYAEQAVHEALINLEASAAPAGEMPVVLGAGWPGILLHEAVGHGLEADFNRKGSSVYSNKIGQCVASTACTLVDDATVPDQRGSLNVDDEGVPGQKTVLIENGMLKSYMQDRLNAKLMQLPMTGNGRRVAYSTLPLPRMTNTYLMPGEYASEEIIASVDRGLYAVNFSGGQVDITSGKFVFSTSEAYLIEHGKIGRPVKRATLIGSGPEVLHKISMVGSDLQLDPGIGFCGKGGQSVPVGVGQPTLKVDTLVVGGTQE